MRKSADKFTQRGPFSPGNSQAYSDPPIRPEAAAELLPAAGSMLAQTQDNEAGLLSEVTENVVPVPPTVHIEPSPAKKTPSGTLQCGVETIPATRSTVMRCDRCFVSDRGCPKYKTGADCSMNFGELFQTVPRDEALKESVYHIIELQFERVQRGGMIEKLNEGVLDPALSAEISRYYDLLLKTKQISSTENSLHISARGSAAGGLLSKLLDKEPRD